MVENFLTNPRLADARVETGTAGLTPEQIEVLTDPLDSAACAVITRHLAAYPPPEDFHRRTYFRAGEFYFVTQVIVQAETMLGQPGEVVVGIESIWIYNEEIEYVGGYGG